MPRKQAKPPRRSPLNTPEISVTIFLGIGARHGLELRGQLETQIAKKKLGVLSGTDAGFNNQREMEEVTVFFQPYDIKKAVPKVEKILEALDIDHYQIAYGRLIFASKDGAQGVSVDALNIAAMFWEEVYRSDLRVIASPPVEGTSPRDKASARQIEKRGALEIFNRWLGPKPPFRLSKEQKIELALALPPHRKRGLTPAQKKKLAALTKGRVVSNVGPLVARGGIRVVLVGPDSPPPEPWRPPTPAQEAAWIERIRKDPYPEDYQETRWFGLRAPGAQGHLREDKRNKFWTIRLDGRRYSITCGLIGSEGLTTVEKFASPNLMMIAANRMIDQIRLKGYHEITRKMMLDPFEIPYLPIAAEEKRQRATNAENESQAKALIQRLSTQDQRFYAADCVTHVLPIFEEQHPDDLRPRQAVEAAVLFGRGRISAAQLHEAGEAAADAEIAYFHSPYAGPDVAQSAYVANAAKTVTQGEAGIDWVIEIMQMARHARACASDAALSTPASAWVNKDAAVAAARNDEFNWQLERLRFLLSEERHRPPRIRRSTPGMMVQLVPPEEWGDL